MAIHAFFKLLAYSGIRKGEAFALRWADINFKDQEIKINKAISRGIDNKLYLKGIKTGEARSLKMDGETIAILSKREKKQQKELLQNGFDTLNKNQLVFSINKNEFIQPSKSRQWIT